MPGVTAWYGLNKIIAPKKGETIVVSAATGAVGSVAGQLAKLAGAKTIGIAGGPAKCAYAREELGYDLCVDHKSPDFAAELKTALPDGVDGLFENVGGVPFATCMRRLNDFARVAICGLIASYEGEPTVLDNVATLLITRSKIEGFIISDHRTLWPQALSELAGHVADKRIRYRETIAQGLEKAPEALIDVLKGRNFGKQLVKLI
jgi:NADPH-dependent curcumin reductase